MKWINKEMKEDAKTVPHLYMRPYLISFSGLGLTSMLSPKNTGCMRVLGSVPVEFSSR